ncbi:replication initiator protein A [Paenibacillus alvei]|uniref:replication initiator protein A n=1 Tax=Paenibacillus alvei TaxID=44250 RepID=UPI000287E04C|nr:replication initiator protein A [Paenibacillus alvei]EJW14368.1 replication initiator protein A RepA [Paenibacillus alvei DSM 29]MCY9539396.1 replication initiator protein A [Paenibacillus alvei]MEC0079826.1 replication initiator protein A [Paenibacillus alvei]
MSQDRRHRKEDYEQTRFYQLPKSLFQNERYKGLHIGAKAMYAILRDRQDLSIKNDWADEEGFIYFLYSIDELADLIEMDRKTVIRYKKILIEYGLLIAKSMGNGLADRLYVLKPEMGSEETSPKKGLVPKKDCLPVPKKDSSDTDISNTEYMNECMKAQKEISATTETATDAVQKEVYEILREEIPKHCFLKGLPLSDSQVISIFLMLIKQFSNRLNPDAVSLAARLYFDRACYYDLKASNGVSMKIDIDNPEGFFHTCYKDALKLQSVRK